MGENRKALRYIFDGTFRARVMWMMNRITFSAREQEVDRRRQDIKKILLVRGLFRMGDSILATPAILLLRHNFPAATIDFVGPRIGKKLFQNLPIDHYYEIYRSFPKVCWSYLVILKRLRRAKYDLALDVSGSSAALGSFIVGFSGARLRAGLRGKWDRWFNIRLPRPSLPNKYVNLPELIGSMGLESRSIFPKVALSREEIAQGGKRIKSLIPVRDALVVGVFVGGRKSRGKRWATGNFVELATRLRAEGARPIIFVGPEERETLVYLRAVLAHRAPVIFEPNIRSFASLVANCSLFVAGDSGPVHLACALRVRTVVLFLQPNFERRGPPPSLGRIVFRETGVGVTDVLEASRIELSALSGESVAAKIVNG